MAQIYPNRSLHGSIVHELGKRIVLGRYAEGETLPVEDTLREELEVSRNALREAVKVLSAKGLLQVKTRVGTQVLPRAKWNLTDPDVLAWALCGSANKEFFLWLNEFRSAIEPAAAEAAARRASEEDKARVRERIAVLESIGEERSIDEAVIDRYTKADIAFHEALFAAAGNPFMQCVATQVSGALTKSRKLTHQVEGAFARALPVHRQVADAVIAGDASAARRGMETLFRYVAEDIEQAFEAKRS